MTLSLKIRHAGPGSPPQAFSTSLRLRAGERLQLGSLVHLDMGARTLHVTLSGGGRRRSISLVNRLTRPVVRIIGISAKRVRRAAKVTIRLAGAASGSGVVFVSVRGSGRASRTAQVVARRRMKLSFVLPAQRRGQRLRVWAVAVTRGGQAGRIATGTVHAR
jgi:hypothetical protein